MYPFTEALGGSATDLLHVAHYRPTFSLLRASQLPPSFRHPMLTTCLCPDPFLRSSAPPLLPTSAYAAPLQFSSNP